MIALDKDRKKKKPGLPFIDDSDEFEMPHIELCSNKSAIVEGCRGIIEYCESTVRINCGNVVVKLCGDCLGISSPNTDTIAVKGTIVSVEYCT